MENELNKMTAVEWLIEDLGEYFPHGVGGIELMVKKAKEMEKQQIKDAYNYGQQIPPFIYAEQYYAKTYGGKDGK
jgi:hypothetical protein